MSYEPSDTPDPSGYPRTDLNLPNRGPASRVSVSERAGLVVKRGRRIDTSGAGGSLRARWSDIGKRPEKSSPSLGQHRASKDGLDKATALSGCLYCRAMDESIAISMHVLARQTENRLAVLRKDVSECKSVDEAANFTRWLRASGVLALLERFSTDGVLPVDGKSLSKLSETILSDCGDLYRNGKATPRYAASDIAEINRKLDIIAHEISQQSRSGGKGEGGEAAPPCPLHSTISQSIGHKKT